MHLVGRFSDQYRIRKLEFHCAEGSLLEYFEQPPQLGAVNPQRLRSQIEPLLAHAERDLLLGSEPAIQLHFTAPGRGEGRILFKARGTTECNESMKAARSSRVMIKGAS